MSVNVGRGMGSESGGPMTHEEASALLGAYALGVLSQAERTAVEAHLQAAPKLRAELAEHRHALTRLMNAEPLRAPPTGMKSQLMAQIAAAAKTPPLQSQPLSEPQAKSQPKSRRASLGDWLRGGLALPRLAVATMSLVALVAVGGLGSQVLRLSSEQLAYRQAMDLMYDDGASKITLGGRPAAPAATGTLRFKPEGQVALLEAHDLPVLEPTRAYQLWLVYPDNTRDTGAIFQVDGLDGTTMVVVRSPKPFNSYVRFGISIEPAGGSPAPTGPGALSSRA